MRILIVEDEVKIRVGMGKLIATETEHEVVGEAKNGKEGLEFIERFKPDLVITDIKMPEMDGLEMLLRVKELGISLQTIILTGYAEFEYARTAITLGVNNYLLKPIGVEELTQMLFQISEKIRAENEKMGTLEGFLMDIYIGNEDDSKESLEKIKYYCKKKQIQQYSLYIGYIGDAPPLYAVEFAESMEKIMEKYKKKECIISYVGKLQEIICLFMEQIADGEIMERFNQRVMRPYCCKNHQAVWAKSDFTNIMDLYKKMKTTQDLLPFGMLAGNNQVLTKELVDELEPEEYIFPSEFPNAFKIAICNADSEKIKQLAKDYIQYMQNHHFMPEKVKHGYMKLYLFLANLLQDIDVRAYEQLSNRYIMKKLTEAKTCTELECAFLDSIPFLINFKGKKEDIRNYTIKRAINYIREHYKEGITLEEMARKLEITPEYLSTLFYKEMNINYSTFLKEFRISHAKRLLKGTDMKVYEIAQEVGYSDPKYFIRVFRELQGQSPKEYRQQN